MASDRISITLKPENLSDLQEMAAKRERSISWIAGHAIRFYLEETRKKSAAIQAFEDPKES